MAQGQYTADDIQTPPRQTGQYSASDIAGRTSLPAGFVPDVPPGFVPDSEPLPSENASSQSPSLLDRAERVGSEVWDTLPGIGTAHALSGALEKWAAEHEPLNNPDDAAKFSPTRAALQQFATGTLADTAALVHGATSPQSAALAGGAIVAPEVVAPAMLAHGVYSGVNGWGDIRNPDVLQHELNSAAEVAGGASLGADAIRTGGGTLVRGVRAGRAFHVPVRAAADLANAIPPSKSAPYSLADYQAARPYLDAEHVGSPIESVGQLRDAADSAIGKIEDLIGDRIASLPNVRFKATVASDVKNALQGNPRGQSFVDAGMKDLEDFHLDQPKTLAEADAIRRQLNAENQAVLQRNNYQVANARATDPAFAAREAAAESLRNGIYNQLSANGFPGARQLRLDEGSLIKIRNAAQNQAFNGERIVGSTRNGLAARAMRNTGRVVGAGVGAKVGGPGGAIGGEYIGDTIGTALAPKGLTRDQLVARSFRDVQKPTAAAHTVPVARPALRVATRAVPAMTTLRAMAGERWQ